MLETLSIVSKKAATGALLDISFESAALGTKTIIDKAQGIPLTLFPNNSAGSYGVVDVAGVGRCYQFDGLHYFYNSANVLGDFDKDSYDIEIGYIRPGTSLNVLFCTGEYADGKGTSLSTHSFGDSYFQAFRVDSTNTFARQLLSGGGVTTITEVVIQKRPGGCTLKNVRTGQVQAYDNFDTKGNTYLALGAQRSGNYAFTGYLKYFRIKKVTT